MNVSRLLKDNTKKIYRYIGLNCVSIHYNVKTSSLRIRCPKVFEDRGIKSLGLFMQAFEYAKPEIANSFSILLNCDDFPTKQLTKRPVFAYSKCDSQTNIHLFPDFIFDNWKETGLYDYDMFCKEMVEASFKEPIYNSLFWIGNAETHPTRKVLCNLSSCDQRIQAYSMGWDYRSGKAVPNKFVSLIDHTKYKYLIDIQGKGYSGRTKLLMFSGRCLFIADRKWKEYWYEDIQPFVHYIPVKEDLSDLIEKLDWAENHQREVCDIANNAREYAINHLMKRHAIEYFAKEIVSVTKQD